jgi:NADH:ubiquinone oxidoreductase subunit 2 (subunit N)
MHFSWLPDILPQLLIAGGGFLIFCAGAFPRKKPAELLFTMALCTVALTGMVTMVVEPHANHFLALLGVAAYDRFFIMLVLIITGLTLLFADYYSKLRWR